MFAHHSFIRWHCERRCSTAGRLIITQLLQRYPFQKLRRRKYGYRSATGSNRTHDTVRRTTALQHLKVPKLASYVPARHAEKRLETLHKASKRAPSAPTYNYCTWFNCVSPQTNINAMTARSTGANLGSTKTNEKARWLPLTRRGKSIKWSVTAGHPLPGKLGGVRTCIHE